jgi:hypothetical protein
VRLEELGKLKKSTSPGIRTGDLPACSIVPQSTTLPRGKEEAVAYFEALSKHIPRGTVEIHKNPVRIDRFIHDSFNIILRPRLVLPSCLPFIIRQELFMHLPSFPYLLHTLPISSYIDPMSFEHLIIIGEKYAVLLCSSLHIFLQAYVTSFPLGENILNDTILKHP